MLRKKGGGGGGHGGSWVISFADLMSLLMAFFVMLLSFSVQDQEKLNMAAGSVQEAFGLVPYSSVAGMIERDGNPQRQFLRDTTNDRVDPTAVPLTDEPEGEDGLGRRPDARTAQSSRAERARQFAVAAASLRQAWQDLPQITAISENLVVEETTEGLNIVIADRSGRAMFPEGSKYPYEMTRKAIAAMAPLLQRLPNQIRVTGHTASGTTFPDPRYGPWELSFDRANVTRQILEEFGLAGERIESVVGRADAEPFFPNDPYLAANQRVSILVVYEEPPAPVDLRP